MPINKSRFIDKSENKIVSDVIKPSILNKNQNPSSSQQSSPFNINLHAKK